MNTVRCEPVILTLFSTDKDTLQSSFHFADGYDPGSLKPNKISIVEPTHRRKPKRLSAFIFYTRQRRPQILQEQTFTENIKEKTTEMMKKEWDAMAEETKEQWKSKEETDFNTRMDIYETERKLVADKVVVQDDADEDDDDDEEQEGNKRKRKRKPSKKPKKSNIPKLTKSSKSSKNPKPKRVYKKVKTVVVVD
jgi:hypothetical protein